MHRPTRGPIVTAHRRTSGQFELPVPASEAIGLFTPEGERTWAPGWDPTYPAGEVSEDPGTVFVTNHGGRETIWLIEHLDRVDGTAAYARVTPERHAGTVRVRCNDQRKGGCIVSVEYHMTSLSPTDTHILDPYADRSFASMMDEWAALVTEDLANR